MEFNIMDLIQVELIIIIAVTYVLGLFLKSYKGISDWVIPFVLLGFGVALSILYKAVLLAEGFTPESVLSGFIYGVLIAGIAVFGNQLIKQGTERDS